MVTKYIGNIEDSILDNMKNLIHLPESAKKSYSDQPEYIGLGIAFVLYSEYRVTPNFKTKIF